MLTIHPMGSDKSYSADYLEQSDYYEEGQRVTGQWFGKGAAHLGLTGEVVSEDFDAVRQGRHPETGGKLRPRQSADRKAADGSPFPRPRAFRSWRRSATTSG